MKSGPKIPAEYLSKDSELQQQPPRRGHTVHYSHWCHVGATSIGGSHCCTAPVVLLGI